MPERWGIDVFGTTGALRMRIGDISGLPWGGRDVPLPEGTYGVWGERGGVWLSDYVAMFYAHVGTSPLLSATVSPIFVQPGTAVITVEEALPFGAISVPPGRVVTTEVFLYAIPVLDVLDASFNPPQWRPTDNRLLRSIEVLASRNGGPVQSWNAFTGPDSGAPHVYTSCGLRLTLVGVIDFADARQVRVQYVRAIRMFSHDVHPAPTWSVVSASLVGGTSAAVGSPPDGTSTDPGGGSGTDPSPPVGEVPGGDPGWV